MKLDHIAIKSNNITLDTEWYKKNMEAQVLYQDETWSLMIFENGTKLALVTPSQHPQHIAFEWNGNPDERFKLHRDGTKSFYEKDPSGNIIEWIWYPKEK